MRLGALIKTIFFGVVLTTLSAAVAVASEEDVGPSADHPAMSPDGTRLVFVSDVNGSRDLWIANANGSNASALTPWSTSDENSPTWSPDGNHVVFSSTRGSTKPNIWVIGVDGSAPKQLTSDPAAHEQPQYSPQGSSILYVANATGKRELWLMNPDGSAQHSIALIPLRISDPAWSPDGSTIAYVGCHRGAECNLFSIRADGSHGLRITAGDFQDWNPSWGAAGVLFASNRGGNQGLWLVQPDGTGLQQVTAPDATGDLYPRWVGNSNAFVFSRSGKGAGDAAADIWLATAVGATAVQLTKLVVDTTPPVIVPVVTGNVGTNGWYTSGVTIAWQVSDPESGIVSSAGCDPMTISDDTLGVTLGCTAQNGVGLSASVPVTVKIDKTPPTIVGMPSAPCTLWPPNHKLVQVGIVSATDGLSGVWQFDVAATSSYSATQKQDIIIAGAGTDPRTVQVRSERLGSETARVYTIVASATDQAGNASSASAVCTVPHDQGH